MPFRLLAALCFLLLAPISASAQQTAPPSSKCMAIAQTLPGVIYADFTPAEAAGEGEVVITYAGHSTYLIDTPAGVRIATDFSGVYGGSPAPKSSR